MKFKYSAFGVRWFDRANGNTYHSVRIVRHDDGATLVCPFQYGYGDCYRQTALEAMAKAGWLPPEYCGQSSTAPMCFERENGYPILWSCRDSTKRECVANGKD